MAGFAAKTMIYRGLGSGIVRAMREDNHIDFDNEVSANQFKVTIWRTTQKKPLKDSNTIQKSDTTTQKKPLKDSRTIQKDSGAIQKNDSTIQKNLDSSEEVLKFLIDLKSAIIRT